MSDSTPLGWLAVWQDINPPAIPTRRKRNTKKIVRKLKTFTIFDKLDLELKYMIWEHCLDNGQIISIEYPDRPSQFDQPSQPRFKLTYKHHKLLHICHDSRKLACEFFRVSFLPRNIAEQTLDDSMGIAQPAMLRCLAIKGTCSWSFDVNQKLFDHCGQPERVVLSRDAGVPFSGERRVIDAIDARNLKIDRKFDAKAGKSPVVESLTRKALRIILNIRKKRRRNKSAKRVTPRKNNVNDEPAQDPDSPFSTEGPSLSNEDTSPQPSLFISDNVDPDGNPYTELFGFREQDFDDFSELAGKDELDRSDAIPYLSILYEDLFSSFA
ncbi:hypothetical protein BKA64DRAFT_640183 [Cadophora sp. MPI-SDFR-AT-0126]|nr:hypothetical protein BKA64DRAFT_640183 [Leotiomycetes sp. MPI-SDFR-AT-0126]